MICSMLIKLPCSIAIGYVPLIISQIVNRICSIVMVSRGWPRPKLLIRFRPALRCLSHVATCQLGSAYTRCDGLDGPWWAELVRKWILSVGYNLISTLVGVQDALQRISLGVYPNSTKLDPQTGCYDFVCGFLCVVCGADTDMDLCLLALHYPSALRNCHFLSVLHSLSIHYPNQAELAHYVYVWLTVTRRIMNHDTPKHFEAKGSFRKTSPWDPSDHQWSNAMNWGLS